MRTIAALLLFATSLAAAEPGTLTRSVVTRADPKQTYALYLPSTYDGVKKHPVLLVMDPSSNGPAAAEIFRPAAEEYGWIILSANGTLSGDGDANEAAAQAMVPELNHYPVMPGRVYAAGFSGTAILAWQIGIATGALHGVIGVGGRNVRIIPPAQFSFAHYGFAGDADFNNREMREVYELLEQAGKVHRFDEFIGEHRWITPELARDAVGWMELVAMKDGRRPKDEALISKLHAKDAAAAVALEASGKKLQALRRYRAIAATFDSADARASAARLEKDPAVARERKEVEKWDEFERNFHKTVLGNVRALFARFREDDLPQTQARLSHELRVPELQRRAKRPGYESLVARRLLNVIYGHTAFRLIHELFAQGEYSLAAMTVGVATEIHPERWASWYNQGAAYARAGNAKGALASLEKAVETGFRNAKQLAADEDFASLRGGERFQALLKKLE
jgi:tetratricopeptide (TPR) repeat protein